jgi:hypothetical protein
MKIFAIVWTADDHQPELVAINARIAHRRFQQMFDLQPCQVVSAKGISKFGKQLTESMSCSRLTGGGGSGISADN